jgi:hypothetical protein
MTQSRGGRPGLGVLLLVLTGLTASNAFAQTTTRPVPPPSQDDELRLKLGLGNASGCFTLLGVDNAGDDVADELARLGSQIGNELRAICSPSAVASASSLGGGLQSLQAVKTVTQFSMPRNRIDQRLIGSVPPPPMPPPPPKKEFTAQPFQGASPALTAAELQVGGGVFGEVQFITRNRADTVFESGYGSDVTDFSVGADALIGRGIIGGWFGRSRQEGTFTRFGVLADSANASVGTVLGQTTVLSNVCGGLSTAGTFEQNATRIGGFAGWGTPSGFVDGAYAWTRREHQYSRSICAIEFQGTLSVDPVTGRLRDSVNNPVDDIYAGVLTGLSTIRETSLSARAGGDFGNDVATARPRAIATLTRASTAAYVETGRSTVANTVTPVDAPAITRQLGGPIGLELAYDKQSRTSMLLEAGGEIAVHAGPVSPYFTGYWRHEFMDDFPIVTAHLAQDRRPSPAVLAFGYDAYDRQAFQFGWGVTAIGSHRFAARFEITHLVSDRLFSGRAMSIQARVGF